MKILKNIFDRALDKTFVFCRLGRLIAFIFCIVAGILFVLQGHSKETIPVSIETKNGNVLIQAETALTPAQQANGLMYRSKLAADSGMIFIFPRPKMVSMWMKNTHIPLDMIFFNEAGRITHIHSDAHPLDETIISSVLPAIGVVEVNAGFAKQNLIRVGQKISYPHPQPK